MMKTFNLFILSMIVTACMLGQEAVDTIVNTVLPPGLPNPFTDLPGTIETLYGVGLIILGYVSQLIPGVNKIKPWLRVIALAVISGGAIIAAGFSSFFPILVSYALSSKFYDDVLKKIMGLKTAKLNPVKEV